MKSYAIGIKRQSDTPWHVIYLLSTLNSVNDSESHGVVASLPPPGKRASVSEMALAEPSGPKSL